MYRDHRTAVFFILSALGSFGIKMHAVSKEAHAKNCLDSQHWHKKIAMLNVDSNDNKSPSTKGDKRRNGLYKKRLPDR
jgi:hypothetical protein